MILRSSSAECKIYELQSKLESKSMLKTFAKRTSKNLQGTFWKSEKCIKLTFGYCILSGRHTLHSNAGGALCLFTTLVGQHNCIVALICFLCVFDPQRENIVFLDHDKLATFK